MNELTKKRVTAIGMTAGGVAYAFILTHLLSSAFELLQFLIAQPESFYTNKMLFLLIVLFAVVGYATHWAIHSCLYLLKNGLQKIKEAWPHENPSTDKHPPRTS